jgi:hypothetical protein
MVKSNVQIDHPQGETVKFDELLPTPDELACNNSSQLILIDLPHLRRIMEPSVDYPSIRKDSDGQKEELSIDYPNTMDTRSIK